MPDWSQEALEALLREKGWYRDQKSISNGIQYRLADDTPIDFYLSTGRVVVRGKSTPLKVEAEAFFKETSQGLVAPNAATPAQMPSVSSPQDDQEQGGSVPTRVFIVYGRDGTAREQLELILRRLKLEPIILRNLSGRGDTIIENLDALTDADFACVLLTPDDKGCLAGDGQNLRPRSRQNVILELGMVLAKLGRRRVAILVKDVSGQPIERPTDIDGIIYISFENHVDETKNLLATRLEEAGFKIRVADLVG